MVQMPKTILREWPSRLVASVLLFGIAVWLYVALPALRNNSLAFASLLICVFSLGVWAYHKTRELYSSAKSQLTRIRQLETSVESLSDPMVPLMAALIEIGGELSEQKHVVEELLGCQSKLSSRIADSSAQAEAFAEKASQQLSAIQRLLEGPGVRELQMSSDILTISPQTAAQEQRTAPEHSPGESPEHAERPIDSELLSLAETLRGSAESLKAKLLQDMCQAAEDCLRAVGQGGDQPGEQETREAIMSEVSLLGDLYAQVVLESSTLESSSALLEASRQMNLFEQELGKRLDEARAANNPHAAALESIARAAARSATASMAETQFAAIERARAIAEFVLARGHILAGRADFEELREFVIREVLRHVPPTK